MGERDSGGTSTVQLRKQNFSPRAEARRQAAALPSPPRVARDEHKPWGHREPRASLPVDGTHGPSKASPQRWREI